MVTIYSRLNTRTYFDQAATGQTGQDVWLGDETVGQAPRAAGGGVWARVPIDVAPKPDDLLGDAFDPGYQSGVYPVRVQILRQDYAAVGGSLSTFLAFSADQSTFPRLSVAITVPVTATPVLSPGLLPTRVTPVQSESLSAVAAVLAARSGVAVDLAVSPQTTQALQAGSAADRTTLARLASLARRGDEVLPEPYVPVALSGLDAAGLDTPGADDQLGAQLAKGAAVLRTELGVAPSTRTWVFDGSAGQVLDDSTVQRLHESGLRDVVLPDDTVTGLPTALRATTYGRPTALDDGGDPGLRVMATDPVLQARLTQPTGPVLSAEQTLAELAMIELETPGIARGTAITLPADGSASGVYLSTLLAGLRNNPFVRGVTAERLFATVSEHVPAAVSTTRSVPVRSLRPLPVSPVADAGLLQGLETRIDALALVLPVDTQLVAGLRAQLLVAPADGLPASTRSTLLASIQAHIGAATSSVRLPGNISVTLTSLKATLPLTILSETGPALHVSLSLESPKLDFRAYRPDSGGSCTVTDRTSEVCDLVLRGPETNLRVPVEARTSGVFFLDVAVTSPDGSITLASARDTVRSTAVSFVGIVIIVGAVLLLGMWWIRDIRSGRRARQLVERTSDGADDDGDGGPPDGGIGPEPPERPAGPAEPIGPPGRAVPAPRRTVDASAHTPTFGPTIETPTAVPAGLHRHGAPRRRRPLARHRADAATELRRMSPSPRPPGPIRRTDDPPEELAP